MVFVLRFSPNHILHTFGNLRAICPKSPSDPVELSSIFEFVHESPSLSTGWNHKWWAHEDFQPSRVAGRDESHPTFAGGGGEADLRPSSGLAGFA